MRKPLYDSIKNPYDLNKYDKSVMAKKENKPKCYCKKPKLNLSKTLK